MERMPAVDVQQAQWLFNAAEIDMKALVWHGTTDIRCDSVPDPTIEHVRDAIIKVTSCAICGSDLHLYDHFMPGMKSGDVMGHETVGEVVSVGPAARKSLKVGDRVVIAFTIICGECEQCRRGRTRCMTVRSSP
jgi:threonine dehydrogenase-like Zn-dependent dehydrogenase